MDDAVFGDIDDLDEMGAGQIQSAAGCGVFGVAGDPEDVEAILPGYWHEKAQGSGSVPVAAMGGVNCKPDVSRITLDVGSGSDAEVDAAEFFPGAGVHHAEVIRGDVVDAMR
jgi:hypothetical protein